MVAYAVIVGAIAVSSYRVPRGVIAGGGVQQMLPMVRVVLQAYNMASHGANALSRFEMLDNAGYRSWKRAG